MPTTPPKKFTVRLHPGSSRQRITTTSAGFEVWLHAKPISGEANTELIKLLARHLKTPPSSLTIIRGLRSRFKLILIN